MPFPPRSLVVTVAIALAMASLLAAAPHAAAAQNRPTWTQGDFWLYTRTAGGETSTVRMDVHERTTLTLASGTYTVWHVTTTVTPSGGNATVQHSWIQDSNLGIAKANFSTVFGEVQVTFDPPVAQAVFPLSVNAQWSLNATVRLVDFAFSFNLAYSGNVIAEESTSVPAGTFAVAVIRTPSTGSAHDRNYYSEGSGNHVRQESYDGSGNRVANQELTSYRYQSGTTLLILLVVGGLIAFAFVVGAIVTIRRRRSRMPPPGIVPPAQPPSPPQPPPP